MKFPLEDLKKYKTQEKFSTKEWKKRHVNPSDKTTNERMENFANNCISEIINIENFTKKEAASIIDKHLNKARKSGFDTEEFEFIVDVFYKTSEIINITQFVKEFRNDYFFHQQNENYNSEIHDGHEEIDCRKCKKKLEIIILEKEITLDIVNGIYKIDNDKDNWAVIACDFCKELNILKIPKFTQRMMYKNCLGKSTLNTYHEALNKIDELKKPLNFKTDDFSDKYFLDYIKEPIHKRVKYLSVLMSKEKPNHEPLMFWLNTGEKIWYRFFIDAWQVHWNEYDEQEKVKVIEEDFEDNDNYYVRDLAQELNLLGKKLNEIEVRRYFEKQLLTSQIKISVENNLTIVIRDYDDKIPSELLITIDE